MKKKLYAILERLGLKQKFEDKSLTQEEFNTLVAEYQKEYQTTIEQDLQAEQAVLEQTKLQETLNTIHGVIASVAPEVVESEENAGGENHGATMEGVIASINNLGQELKKMAKSPAEDVAEQTVTVSPVSINGFGNTPEYLFGIEHPMFDMKKRWNQIAAAPRNYPSMVAADEEVDGRAFNQELRAYGRSLQQRMSYLVENKLIGDLKALATGEFSNNYSGLASANLGDQFIIRRQDALIARILAKRDLTQYFPVVYGIQDRAVLINAFFGEVSQGYQPGEVYKGGMEIEPNVGYVDDAMIKIKWGPMKEIERMYIGYLNREGSDPIKWTMIEFQLLNSLLTAQIEQNKRRMRGIYVKPETGVAGSYLNAGTGIMYTLLRYVHENKLKTFDDVSYNSYTNATFLAAVQAFVSAIKSKITEDMDIDNHVLYLNKNHQDWWIKNIRSTYHVDTDFTGTSQWLNRVPDTDVNIIWLPYMGQSTLMFMAEPGNIQFLEYVPGEMLSVKMEQQMEMVRAWSTWKEGCGAPFTGRVFATKALMDANDYKFQQIFLNKPAKLLAAGATTIDGTAGRWFITAANESATALTGITNAKAGVAYCIECGSTTNKTTIAKSGNFTGITAAYTPTAVGDYIMVILNSDGKFSELERCVGGVRTINQTLQPNVPGGR